MATKGMKQPYWLRADRVTVMTWLHGERVIDWVAPNETVARDYIAHAIRCYQLKSYGRIDQGLEKLRTDQPALLCCEREALERLKSGALHWSDIGSRRMVDMLHLGGYLHRSQAGRYYLTPEGQQEVSTED